MRLDNLIYKQKFDTREEAKERHSDISHLLNRPLGFCPLINDVCRTDCVCYQPSKVIIGGYDCKRRDHYYKIQPSYCIHALILGEINIYS